MSTRPNPEDGRYFAGRLHEALLAAVGEQDLQVDVADGAVHVSGSVATPERRDAVDAVIASEAPGWTVHNDVRVVPTTDPPDREDMP